MNRLFITQRKLRLKSWFPCAIRNSKTGESGFLPFRIDVKKRVFVLLALAFPLMVFANNGSGEQDGGNPSAGIPDGIAEHFSLANTDEEEAMLPEFVMYMARDEVPYALLSFDSDDGSVEEFVTVGDTIANGELTVEEITASKVELSNQYQVRYTILINTEQAGGILKAVE